MERYESLGLVGEGSYGAVLKCRHRHSGRLVAIKKFMDSDDDQTVKKIALREIKLLRQLRHDNLVNLLEVWKHRRRWYLVFEFVERTLLDDLEHNPSGLDLNTGRGYLYQILRAAAFCHQQNIIHRDIKPENVLISQGGVVKLCDFGFARTVASPAEGGVYTDYVATRWYRAPELLVGDTKYSKPVDVWAVGCLLMEMLTGQPLFPGDSDLDQIYHIVRCFGNLTAHHQELFHRNPVFSGVRLPECSGRVQLEQRFPAIAATALDLAQSCLQMDPERRAQCSELLEHPLFTQDSFHSRVLDELNAKIQKDHRENSTLPKIAKTPRREKDEGDEKNRRSRGKKQLENMDEKVNKEKVMKGEERMEETKGKQPSKLIKTIRNASEPLMFTKTIGTKVVDNAAKTTVVMKSKLGKATGAELRKELDIYKPTKALSSHLLEASKTARDLKDNNTVVAKPKHGKVASPEPRQKNTHTKDKGGLHCSCSDNIVSSVTENSVTEIWTSSNSEPTQDFGKSWNNSNSKEHQADCSSTDTDKRRTSECPEVLPSNLKPSKTSSNSGPKMTKNNKRSLSCSPSKTLTSDISTQSSTVFIGTSPAHSTTTPPKGTSNSKLSKTGSSLDTKPTNHPTCAPNKPSRGLPTDGEHTGVSIADKDISEDHECLNMSPATKTNANHIETSNASGGLQDYKESPESSEPSRVHQQSTPKSKITTESATSTSMRNEIPATYMLVGTIIPKTLKVSDKENRENLAVSVSVSATTKSLLNQISKVSRSSNIEQRNNSSEAEPNIKSLKPPHSKSLIRESKTKLGPFGNYTKSTATMALNNPKTKFSTEARKKRGNPENISTMSDSSTFTSTATLDQRALTRSSVLPNMDTADLINEFDFSVPHSSPPLPPPSSTPLLLPPYPTPLIPPFSVLSTISPAASDHRTLAAGFHLGTHSLRCVDKPKHHGGVYSRLTQQSLSSHITGPLAAQVSEKSLICERSFLSDRCNLGNGSGITVTREKSDIRFPDLRSLTLPELRGREGKRNKGTSKNQRKDKQPVPSSPASEPPTPN